MKRFLVRDAAKPITTGEFLTLEEARTFVEDRWYSHHALGTLSWTEKDLTPDTSGQAIEHDGWVHGDPIFADVFKFWIAVPIIWSGLFYYAYILEVESEVE